VFDVFKAKWISHNAKAHNSDLSEMSDYIGILQHQHVGLRDRCRVIEGLIEGIDVRLTKLEKHVYPAKRVLQGHKR